MSVVHHPSTPADRAALKALRANLAANPVVPSREWFDGLLEQVAPADGVAYSEAKVGGVPGVWCIPASERIGVAVLYLHGGVFVFGSARFQSADAVLSLSTRPTRAWDSGPSSRLRATQLPDVDSNHGHAD
jgi:acetyl esterase/lipase